MGSERNIRILFVCLLVSNDRPKRNNSLTTHLSMVICKHYFARVWNKLTQATFYKLSRRSENVILKTMYMSWQIIFEQSNICTTLLSVLCKWVNSLKQADTTNMQIICTSNSILISMLWKKAEKYITTSKLSLSNDPFTFYIIRFLLWNIWEKQMVLVSPRTINMFQ